MNPDFNAHPLDRWIHARLHDLVTTVTDAFDRYDTPRATRPMREFIDDLSTWYVRRSRDRVKSAAEEDKQAALHTLRHVLLTLAKLMAPVTPFVADEIYRALKQETDPLSVHLASWPATEKQGLLGKLFGSDNTKLITDMALVRERASEALMMRQKANVEVRQPLNSFTIPNSFTDELKAVLAEEINVREIKQGDKVVLDTNITQELKRAGDPRKINRAISEIRKRLDLSPKDLVDIQVSENVGNIDVFMVSGVRGVTSVARELPYTIELADGPASFDISPIDHAA